MLHSADTTRRFFSFVRIDAADKCWPWLGAVSKVGGYGRISVSGRDTRAHRVSYELHMGAIPHGLIVRHDCDNPCCVNPAHLQVGTHQDNTLDMWRRGRNVQGRQIMIEKLRRRTHCAHGHEYARFGFYWANPGHDRNPIRLCRECTRIKNATARAKRKA